MSVPNSLYDIRIQTIDGSELSMENYRGKVLLIVNVASKCGYTPQYTGLQNLHEKYAEKGLVVAGFPCNQFGAQEPGSESDIKEFCSLTYNVRFPMFRKLMVNGEDTHPLYAWLKAQKPGFLGTEAIKWNFTKFLVNREGQVVKRYASWAKPEAIEADIEKELG